jgi:hypothetical protein
MAKKRHYDGMESRDYYAGREGRMKQEREDGDMLHEDKTKMANMPSEIIMKYYPKNNGYLPEDLDDSIRGIDEQIRKDDSKRQEHFKPHKY